MTSCDDIACLGRWKSSDVMMATVMGFEPGDKYEGG